MTYKIIKGNLFDCQAEAYVNTINIFGAMGKGIALEFKKRYPQMFKEYKIACEEKIIQPGKMWIYELNQENPKYIINFPTKRHWRDKSLIQDIFDGLIDLKKVIKEKEIKSIAVPALGCSNGGLDWNQVRNYIVATFESIPEVDAFIYSP